MATLSSHTLFYSHSGLTRTTESTRCGSPYIMPDNKSSLFGSLKKKLARKGSNPLSSQSKMANPIQQRSNNPFASASAAPPTRRPDRAGMNAFTTPSNEPPPAYTPRDQNDSLELPTTTTATTSNDDDPYAFLRTFDTIFLIDDSGSMAGRSWRETGKALETITPICTARDADGIDIHFLNTPDNAMYQNVTSAGTVVEIFQTVKPRGGTPTGQRLNNILRPYLRQYERDPDNTKPINVIVITDGEAQDDVEGPITTAAKKLDRLDAPAWQIGIQFFQVGNEPRAREHLKQLDDDLSNMRGNAGMRDIVDTVPFSGDGNSELTAAGVLKCVLGSVNRRLDRRSAELHRPSVS